VFFFFFIQNHVYDTRVTICPDTIYSVGQLLSGERQSAKKEGYLQLRLMEIPSSSVMSGRYYAFGAPTSASGSLGGM